MKLNNSNLECVLFAGLSLLAFGFCTYNLRAQVDVLTQHNDTMRTGANLKEKILTPATVNKRRFGMLFKRVVDDQLYTQPLIATDVKIGGGWHDVVFVT